MRIHQVWLLILWLGLSCSAQPGQHASNQDQANKLINSSSPYLLQHAYNPVAWNPWGDEALKEAKQQDKLVIISIGYAACHWCHVMEHESFEDTTVAKLMNEHFVSIKVDREERPDIDQIYMNAAYLITGSGGWPLNVIALPDGQPVYAGTYFPKEQWMELLNYFVKLKKETPEKLQQEAQRLTRGIQRISSLGVPSAPKTFDTKQVEAATNKLLTQIDFTEGGLDKAPKFPMPSTWRWLLRQHHQTNDTRTLKAVTHTLDKMIAGGIYDQVGGGFARYSTDAIWRVPHFEKMLYDNGQLVSLLAEAYQATGDERYKAIIYETLAFIERELTDKKGGFYSSLDADSEGEEGKFYIWTAQELDSVLGTNADLVKDYFGVTAKGNWEKGHNILYRSKSIKRLAKKYNINEASARATITKVKQALLKARGSRVRPGLDDKVLTAWNGLMIKGYVDAYKATGEEKFLTTALKSGRFIRQTQLQKDFRLWRNYRAGKSSINGFLDDYSFTIEAFIALYQVTFDESWLQDAKALADYALKHFYNETSGLFYYTSDEDEALITRTSEVPDNVIPSSNASMALSLHQLGLYFYKPEFIKKAERMLSQVIDQAIESPAYHGHWGQLLLGLAWPTYEVAIVGKDYASLQQELQRTYLPNVILMGGSDEGRLELLQNKLVEGDTYIYVCRDKACKLPVTQAKEALQQIQSGF